MTVRGVALCLPCCFLHLQGHCCLASARAPVITGRVASTLASWIPWDMGSAVRGEGQWWGSQDHTGTYTMSSFVRFTDSNTVNGAGARVMGAQAAWGEGFQAPLLLLLMCLWLWVLLQSGGQSHVHSFPCCCWVLWSCGLSCCGQRAWIAGTNSAVPLLLPSLCFLSSGPPTFRRTDVWNSPASCGVGKRHLCWVVDVSLVVDWKEETKVAFHSAMSLTSPVFLFFLIV